MRYWVIAVFVVCFSGNLSAALRALWLSDQPPEKSMLKDMRRRHGGYVWIEGDIDVKQLWLRKGDGLHRSPYLAMADGDAITLDVHKALERPQTIRQDGRQSIRFSMPDEGFYNAYFIQRAVKGRVLTVATAKAEVLHHNCRKGHKYDRNLVNPNQWDDAPLDIIRLRMPDEDFHSRIRSGARLQFMILLHGRPVSGALVTLETQQGWQKSVRSDTQGIASFRIIQDHFADEADSETDRSGWAGKSTTEASAPESQKKTEEDQIASRWGAHTLIQDYFLVTADFRSDQAGELNDAGYGETRYVTTITGRYYPNQLAGKSAMQGLWFTSAGILVVALGTYQFRSSRKKPFKEEVFDER